MRYLFLLLLLAASNVAAAFDGWPDADYDPAIPTMESVLGYAPGERITTHADMRRYLAALQAAAPERMAVEVFGESWQGRDLVYAVLTAPENLARLDEVKEGMQALRNADRTSEAEARRLIGELPAVTWLSYSVHGNEISSTDAALLTAYHLLAARDDPRTAQILAETVVVIDPLMNPDGRERFILRYELSRGLEPDSDRLSAEHNEPWPSGRTNHYLFDLNRDWFKLTQPETRARVAAMQQWYPVAVVDAHEMGSDSTYFFAPEAVPYNPHLAQAQRDNLELFGRNNARWFDRFGIDYFTREIFDAFYPGYGASWPAYFGAVAMTYEQASARGLVVRRADGSEMPYAETVRNHLVASLATAETVAVNREQLLQDFHDYQRSAIEEGRSEDLRSYIVPPQADQAGADKLARLLVAQGARVQQADRAFYACGTEYAQGSYLIDLAQPAKRLLRTLLDTDVPMDEAFVQEQERLREKRLPDQIYDVTAWSLPLMMNVDIASCNRNIGEDMPQLTLADREDMSAPAATTAGTLTGSDEAVAFLVPWGQAPAVRLLTHALRRGLAVKSTDRAFTLDGQRYPAGTLIFDAADHEQAAGQEPLRAQLTALAASTASSVAPPAESSNSVPSAAPTAAPNNGNTMPNATRNRPCRRRLPTWPAATRPISSRNSASTPWNRPKNKPPMGSSAAGPVTQPISRPPTSRTMLFPRKTSWASSFQSVCAETPRASMMPTTMAGISSSTSISGMYSS